jgi:crotonobetainyl-CoA:carnitine CoA-transferase CaiB-like acyl-CoA transferase
VPGLSIADVGGGSLMAAVGILAALMNRARTGEGQLVDVSMTDGAVAWLAYHGADTLFGGVEPRGGERSFLGEAACYNVYRCRDGRHLTVGCIEAEFWGRFCAAVGLPEEIADQWPTGPAAEAQRERVARRLAERDCGEWIELLHAYDVPVARSNTVAEAFRDPQLEHRRMLQWIDHPREGRIPQLGFPIKLSGTPAEIREPPPTLGQHTDAILEDLGFDARAVERLRAQGVV